MSNHNIYVPSISIDNYLFETVAYTRSQVFYNLQDAINYGKKFIREFINNEKNTNIKNFPYKFSCSFYIYEHNPNHIDFVNDKHMVSYCNEILPTIKKDKLYDFCTSVATDVWSYYDYKGNYIFNTIYTDYAFSHDCNFDSKSIFRKSINFKVGDIVRKKGYDELYKVIYVPECILSESDNILGYSENISITLVSTPDDEYNIGNIYEYSPSSLVLYEEDYLDYKNITEKDIEDLINNNKFIDWINIYKSINLSYQFIDKYIDKIDWVLFSAYHKITDDILDRYYDLIDWDIIQARYIDISLDIVSKYPKKINWKWYLKNNPITDELFLKYKKYILKAIKED